MNWVQELVFTYEVYAIESQDEIVLDSTVVGTVSKLTLYQKVDKKSRIFSFARSPYTFK
jgi:hypothetical protein